jgi:hypothetical protein
MWNLRWQVKGLVDTCPEISDEQLVGRFVAGSGIRSGSLKRICVDTPWEDQQSRFAEFLLISVFAIYESWIKELLEALGCVSNANVKGLQFPTEMDNDGNPSKGVMWVVSKINAIESPAMQLISAELATKNKKCSVEKLETYLRWLRYFKEARNCIIHGGGTVGEKLKISTDDVSTINRAADIGMKEAIEYFPAPLGSDIKLSLRGVVGFSEVVRRLMVTTDIQLSRSTSAESDFIRQWKAEFHYESFPTRVNKRDARTRRNVRKLGLACPANVSLIVDLLKSKQLI